MRVHRIVRGVMLTVLIAVTGGSALDVTDVVRQWTAEGKKLAEERAKLPAQDEMVLVPAGWFIMRSDTKADRNAYAEAPTHFRPPRVPMPEA